MSNYGERMTTFFYQSIEDIFTQSRLSVYKKDGVDDITCLARYLFNIELCKSLYPALHIFEITLRNSIDRTLSNYAKTQNWYNVLTIDTESKNKIEEAKRKIKKHGKSITHDRIISELSKCSRYGDWFACKFWATIIEMGTNIKFPKKKCRRHFESVWQYKRERNKRRKMKDSGIE